MAKKKERDDMDLKRIWVRVKPDAHKALLHLAIDMDAAVERLAGRLLSEAIAKAQADFDAGRLKPESKGN